MANISFCPVVRTCILGVSLTGLTGELAVEVHERFVRFTDTIGSQLGAVHMTVHTDLLYKTIICMYVCMRVCVLVCVRACVCMMRMYVCMYVCVHVYM